MTLNPSLCRCLTSLVRSTMYCIMGSFSFSSLLIVAMYLDMICHIDSSAVFFVLCDGAYVPMINVFFFRPITCTPFHLPHPLGSSPLFVLLTYLAIIGCTASVTPPTRLLIVSACAHLHLFFDPWPVQPLVISSSICFRCAFVCCLWSVSTAIIVCVLAIMFHSIVRLFWSPHPLMLSPTIRPWRFFHFIAGGFLYHRSDPIVCSLPNCSSSCLHLLHICSVGCQYMSPFSVLFLLALPCHLPGLAAGFSPPPWCCLRFCCCVLLAAVCPCSCHFFALFPHFAEPHLPTRLLLILVAALCAL